MSQALKNLLTLLNLEKIEEGLFRGQSEDLGLRQVFGGQVVGQALYAAKETVPEERLVHSFHSYFLRPGDSKKPIIYDVETLRDGNSFSARRVAAIQNGKPIFYMTASFQAPEAGFEHQKTCRPRQRLMACLRKRKSPNRWRTCCRQCLKINSSAIVRWKSVRWSFITH